MKKETSHQEETDHPQMVNEPIAAYNTDINALKVKMLERVMQIKSPNIIKKLLSYSIELEEEAVNLTPCQYTMSELEERINCAEEDIKAGRTYDLDVVRKRHPKC